MDNTPVRSRAPLRLGFAGGGSDLSPFCDAHGGYVMNATVALYAYALLTPRTDGQVLLEALEHGQSFSHEAIDVLPLGDAALLHRGVYNRMVREFNGGVPLPVTVRTTVDVPSGSGMGGSSALVVALIEAFRRYLRLPLGEYDLARLAYSIEREDLGLAGGRQDQYAAAFGGFNFMEFHDGERVIVNPLRVPSAMINELEASLVLYYTGQSRASAQIIETQQKNIRAAKEESIAAMLQLKQEALDMKEALLTSSLDRVASTLRRGWEAKKATSDAISNGEIERVLEIALSEGALAGKVSGAGGGGFLMLLCPPDRRQRVLEALGRENGKLLPCKFTDEGALSWRALTY